MRPAPAAAATHPVDHRERDRRIELECRDPVHRLQRHRVVRRRVRQRHQELGVRELLHRDDPDLRDRAEICGQRGAVIAGEAVVQQMQRANLFAGGAVRPAEIVAVGSVAALRRPGAGGRRARIEQRVDLVLIENLGH